MADSVEDLLGRLGREAPPQVILVHGDLVLAEPAALRVVEAALQALHLPAGSAESHRRPTSLSPLLQDLRTFSLFASAKVILAVDTAVFADKAAVSELLAEAGDVLPLDLDGRNLNAKERQAGARLLQALRLCDVDPFGGPAERVIASLPVSALEGRKGKGSKAAKKDGGEALRQGLALLLDAARREGLQGIGTSDVTDLSEALQAGLPAGHVLVFAERTVAADHPLVRTLKGRGALVGVGQLESERGSWQGIDLLVEELERQTGVAIAGDAANELARRTLRQESGDRSRPAGGASGVDSDSTSRFAGEYRKLAFLASGSKIDRGLVMRSVEDRGEEDVWQILDAIAGGKGGEALDRLSRLFASADDEMTGRLSFFALLASYCRQLVAVRGMMRHARVQGGEGNYARFKDRLAPALQGEAPHGAKNPLAGLHPFRLHRAYLAASRLPEPFLAGLLSEVLETELQLKGESAEAETALTRLVVRLSTAAQAR